MHLCGKHLFDDLGWNKVGWQADLNYFKPDDTSNAMKMITTHPSIIAATRLGFLLEGLSIEFGSNITRWDSQITAQAWKEGGVREHVHALMDRKESTEVLIARLNFQPYRQAYSETYTQLLASSFIPSKASATLQ